MGRSTINGPFSIAMLVYQRVIIPTDELHHFSEGWLNHQPVPLAATSVWQITARCRARPSRVTLGEDLSPGFLFRWPNQSAAAKQGAAARQSSGIREVGWWSWGTVGKSMSGCWFQTWLLFSIIYGMSSLPHWLICVKMVKTTNQMKLTKFQAVISCHLPWKWRFFQIFFMEVNTLHLSGYNEEVTALHSIS